MALGAGGIEAIPEVALAGAAELASVPAVVSRTRRRQGLPLEAARGRVDDRPALLGRPSGLGGDHLAALDLVPDLGGDLERLTKAVQGQMTPFRLGRLLGEVAASGTEVPDLLARGEVHQEPPRQDLDVCVSVTHPRELPAVEDHDVLLGRDMERCVAPMPRALTDYLRHIAVRHAVQPDFALGAGDVRLREGLIGLLVREELALIHERDYLSQLCWRGWVLRRESPPRRRHLSGYFGNPLGPLPGDFAEELAGLVVEHCYHLVEPVSHTNLLAPISCRSYNVVGAAGFPRPINSPVKDLQLFPRVF